MADKIRILICDDHSVVREGLRALINTEPNLQVVGEAADGEMALEAFRVLRPDVTLLDMVMPRLDGVKTTRAIKAEYPDARILVLTSFAKDEMIFPAIKAGALGYLLKDSSPDELIRAIHTVARGEASLHPYIARRLLRELSRPANQPPTIVGVSPEALSEREVEVLKLVARGYSNEAIAEELNLSERTARGHVSSILTKLHLANRTQAALFALREGIAKLGFDPHIDDVDLEE